MEAMEEVQETLKDMTTESKPVYFIKGAYTQNHAMLRAFIQTLIPDHCRKLCSSTGVHTIQTLTHSQIRSR